ncbi:EAL domain-containing protein [uncultured Thiodictyon sp.]|uniref:EAL domain-containing response regulator n=1 Tax=uncultured Thiodictyon sp. TaxID=1846217 RepID=UPI0025F12501|nr:EAL domain-containing protein [uncultured Thiodictyon sp.]
MNGDSDTSQAAPGEPGAPRVIVMHDSAMQALLTEHLLKSAGCLVQTLTEPRELSTTMESFRPDLILTPVPIAATSGLELAAVSRGPDGVRLVPILACAVDHRRQPREPQVPGAARDGATALRAEFLVEAVTRRIASMPAIGEPGAVADRLDSETGLASRRYFMRAVARALADPASAQPGNALLVVALDGVGQLNARCGIGVADLAADHIGGLIGGRLGQAGLAVRLDDYRHALLLRCAGAQVLTEAAETLRCAIADSPLQVGEKPVTISVSAGIALLGPAAGDVVTLLKRAELACAEAAAGGGNRIVVAGDGPAAAQDEVQERRLTGLIERALSDADAADGFQCLYQPIVAIGPQGLRPVEVTLRLDAGDETWIPAAEFLPVAERAGRIGAIDRWTMLHALEVLTQQGAAQPSLRIFVRQHLPSLLEDGALAWLRAQMVANGLVEQRPILDLYLPDLLRHREGARSVIAGLRKIGLQVCLVGVDYTPGALDLVSELHPPFVRLAPCVVYDFKPDRFNQLVQRLRRDQAEVIACGIDSAALVAPVWASGVGYAQGTVIYAPRPQLLFDWDELVTE